MQEEFDKLRYAADGWTDSMERSATWIRNRRKELLDGSVMVASILDQKNFWINFCKFFPYTSKAAQILLDMHASTGPAERNWSAWKRLYGSPLRNNLGVVKAEKMVFIKANTDLKERVDKQVCL